jgi:hypothetical protein
MSRGQHSHRSGHALPVRQLLARFGVTTRQPRCGAHPVRCPRNRAGSRVSVVIHAGDSLPVFSGELEVS